MNSKLRMIRLFSLVRSPSLSSVLGNAFSSYSSVIQLWFRVIVHENRRVIELLVKMMNVCVFYKRLGTQKRFHGVRLEPSTL